jgi:glycerate kinase
LGLSAFFPTEIEMGAKWFFEKIDLESKIGKADIVLTGEGQYDGQSAGGKGSFELLQLAKKHNKKVILITSGRGGQDAGFEKVIQLPDLDFKRSDYREKAKENLFEAVKRNFDMG